MVMYDDANTGKSDDELFLSSFRGGYDDDEPWASVHELQRRNSEAVFHRAAEYCRSEVPLQRARSLQVLAQLGGGKPDVERAYVEPSVTIALEHLVDPSGMVVAAAAWTLSHLQGNRAVAALIRIRDNPDPEVRHAVACGMTSSTDTLAVETLILLMEDSGEDVRDWATFGLGSLREEDSSEIRGAFRKRLNDSFEDARQEAIWGLARRKDQQGLTLLLSRLYSGESVAGDEMAACELCGVSVEIPVEELRHRLQTVIASSR